MITKIKFKLYSHIIHFIYPTAFKIETLKIPIIIRTLPIISCGYISAWVYKISNIKLNTN